MGRSRARLLSGNAPWKRHLAWMARSRSYRGPLPKFTLLWRAERDSVPRYSPAVDIEAFGRARNWPDTDFCWSDLMSAIRGKANSLCSVRTILSVIPLGYCALAARGLLARAPPGSFSELLSPTSLAGPPGISVYSSRTAFVAPALVKPAAEPVPNGPLTAPLAESPPLEPPPPRRTQTAIVSKSSLAFLSAPLALPHTNSNGNLDVDSTTICARPDLERNEVLFGKKGSFP
jgi:hypothetical protein